jgi:hypothetical protein
LGGYATLITFELQEMNTFVAEWFANLFEQFAFEKLTAAGVKPTCFANSFYQKQIMFW